MGDNTSDQEGRKETMPQSEAPAKEQPKPIDLATRVRELENELTEVRNQNKELQHSVRETQELYAIMDRIGERRAKRLDESGLPHDTLIRTDELDLISRYSNDVGVHAELIKKLSDYRRTISMARHLLFTPLFHLDSWKTNIGGWLYGALIRRLEHITVVQMEAIVRYAARFLPCASDNEEESRIKRNLMTNLASADYLVDHDKDLLRLACAKYWDEMRTHRNTYQALDKISKQFLQWRDEDFGREWNGMLGHLGELVKKGHMQIPALGLRFKPEDLRKYITDMQSYEADNRIDLNWFRQLPQDLVAFCKDEHKLY